MWRKKAKRVRMGKFLMRCVNLEVHLQTICCDVECVYFKNLRAVRVIQSNSVINVFNKNTLKDNYENP